MGPRLDASRRGVDESRYVVRFGHRTIVWRQVYSEGFSKPPDLGCLTAGTRTLASTTRPCSRLQRFPYNRSFSGSTQWVRNDMRRIGVIVVATFLVVVFVLAYLRASHLPPSGGDV